MPVKTTCSCGKVFQAPDNLVGKSVKCPGCSKPVKVPAGAAVPVAKPVAGKSAPPTVKPPTAKPVPIPAKPASAKPSAQTIKPPVPKPVPASKPSPSAKKAPAPMAGVGRKSVKDFEFDEPAIGARCPKCQVNVSPTDVICTGCGTNLKTGMAMKKTEKGDEEASFSEILLYGGIILGAVLGIGMLVYATFFSK